MECACCAEELNPKTTWPKCGKCLSLFHYKCTNGGMHQASWKSMTLPEREMWLCDPCKSVSPTHERNPKRNLDTSGDMTDSIVYKKLSTEHDTDITLQLNLISQQISTLLGIPNTIANIQEEIKTIGANHTAILEKMINLDNKVATLEIENRQLKDELARQRVSRQETEQYQRRGNIIISNIPGNEKESEEHTTEKVQRLFSTLGVQCREWDILRAHRLPPRKPRINEINRPNDQQPPAVVVKLLKVQLKNQLISASIEKKPTTAMYGAQSGTRIYLNEHLIKETQALFNKSRYLLMKEPIQGLKYYSVSHRDGIIRAKRTQGSRPVKIMNEEDLDRLVAAIKPNRNTQPATNSEIE
jgi:regulator of replication initiation timing